MLPFHTVSITCGIMSLGGFTQMETGSAQGKRSTGMTADCLMFSEEGYKEEDEGNNCLFVSYRVRQRMFNGENMGFSAPMALIKY